MKETKYTVKYTDQFQKGLQTSHKAWLEDRAVGAGRSIAGNGANRCRIRTATMTCPAIGQVIGNVIFSPDWLLVYRIEDDVLVLTLARAGTHSDLFGK